MTSTIASVAAAGTFTVGGDLTVNRLGFGAMRITGHGIWGPPEDKQGAVTVLQRALELGVNFIDTADSYGPEVSEDLIREALHPYADGLVIATKGGLTRQGPNQWAPVGRPEYLKQCVEMSLRRLAVERIDLYQLHRLDAKVPAEETLGALKEMQDAGKLRHVGLSQVTVAEIEMAQKILPIVSVQNLYNVSDRESEVVVKYCEAHGIGFIPWFPIAGGPLAQPGGKLDGIAQAHRASAAQIALAWLLQRSPAILPIPGTSSVSHLEENCSAASIKLSDEQIAELA